MSEHVGTPFREILSSILRPVPPPLPDPPAPKPYTGADWLHYRRIENAVYSQIAAEVNAALGVDVDGRWVRQLVENARAGLRFAVGLGPSRATLAADRVLIRSLADSIEDEAGANDLARQLAIDGFDPGSVSWALRRMVE